MQYKIWLLVTECWGCKIQKDRLHNFLDPLFLDIQFKSIWKLIHLCFVDMLQKAFLQMQELENGKLNLTL